MDSLDNHILEDNLPPDVGALKSDSPQLGPLPNPAPNPQPSLETEVALYSSIESDTKSEVLWNKFVLHNFSFQAKALLENGFCPSEDVDNLNEISIVYVFKQFEQTNVDYKRNLDLMKMTGLALNGVIIGTTFCFCPVQSLTYFGLKLIEQAEWYSFAKEKWDLFAWQLSLHDVAETVSWNALVFCGGSHFYKTLVAPLELSVFKIPVDIVTTTLSGTSIRQENYMELAKFSLGEAGTLYKFISDVCFEGMSDEALKRLSANATIEFYSLMDNQVGLVNFFASGIEEISDNIFDIASVKLAGSKSAFVKLQLLKKSISTLLKNGILATNEFLQDKLTLEKGADYSVQTVEKTLSNVLCKKILFKDFKTNYEHSKGAVLCTKMFKVAFDVAISKTKYASSIVIEYIPYKESYNFTITTIEDAFSNHEDMIQLKA